MNLKSKFIKLISNASHHIHRSLYVKNAE